MNGGDEGGRFGAAGRGRRAWGGAGAAGLVIGVLLGGVLTQAFGWEAVFFVNVPLASVALLLAFALIPADGKRNPGRRFDLPGALTATAGVTMLVFAFVQGPNLGGRSPGILACAIGGPLVLVAFAVLERRGRDPLVPPRLLATALVALNLRPGPTRRVRSPCPRGVAAARIRPGEAS